MHTNETNESQNTNNTCTKSYNSNTIIIFYVHTCDAIIIPMHIIDAHYRLYSGIDTAVNDYIQCI